MLKLSIKWPALLGSALLGAVSALAQDNNALLDTLVKKGYLTTDDVSQIKAEAAATAKSTPK
ncbi:MAG TPA: hypothetical protein VG710_09190, partial [Opitutus sp.]|nr:hypothetical protein [Opitutus sp.]